MAFLADCEKKRLMLNQRPEQTHLKVKTQLLSERLSKQTVVCLMRIWQSAMSSRSPAQLSSHVVVLAAENTLQSSRVNAVCLARAKKALAVCFNYPHAGSPRWAPYVKAGPHPSPAKRGSASHDLSSQFMLMLVALTRKQFVVWILFALNFTDFDIVFLLSISLSVNLLK